MAKSVFDFRDYKAFLLKTVSERGRGEKSKVAAALKCNLAYVSQVLNGPAQFSLEQADLLNSYLGHSEEEAEFFLLLVSHARAGTASLAKRYEAKIRKTLQDRLVLENRLKHKKVLPAESQATYYSAWHYSAIHLLISIPEFQTKEKITRHLRLSPRQISEALEFLVSTGLAEFRDGRYSTGQVALHLQNDSPWLARHHVSWRLQAIRSLEQRGAEGFHYTSVVSMAEEDAPKVRQALIEAIEKVRAVVKDSPEKAVYCYALDFFSI